MVNKVKYIVRLKEDFWMNGTTIERGFCGSIDNITCSHIYFRLNGSNAFVIIPHNKIEWMAPSKVFWDLGYKIEC